VGEQFGVIDERMPESFKRGDVAPVALYRIGHTDDFARWNQSLRRSPQLQLALLTLSAMISQYFTRT
jgi:hypothetical protein